MFVYLFCPLNFCLRWQRFLRHFYVRTKLAVFSLLVRSYDICLHVSRFTQFFSLLLSTFFH